MKLFSGTSARTLTIRFVADVFKANSDIKKTGQGVEKLTSQVKELNKEASSFRARRDAGFSGNWGDDGFGYSGVKTSKGFGMSKSDMARKGMLDTGTGPRAHGKAGSGFTPSSSVVKKTGAWQRMKDTFDNMANSGNGVIRAFASIPGPIKAAITSISGLAYVFSKLIKMGTFVEGRMIQMEVLTGSAKKSRQLTKAAVKYSVDTPFSPAQVFGATSTAVQFGFKDVFKKGAYGLPKDKHLGDIAAGLGSVPDLSGKMMGMDRMMNAIMRGDYRLLRPVRGMVQPAYETAKATGHKVGTPGFNLTFVKALGKIPAIMNLAERQSETVAGLWSTITGFADDMWISLSGVVEEGGIVTFWSQLRDMLKDVRDVGLKIMAWLAPLLVEVGAGIMGPFKFIWDVLKQIARIVVPLFKFLIMVGAQLWRIFLAISKFVKDVLLESLKFVIDLIMIAASGMDRIFGFADKMGSFVATIVEFVAGIQAALIMTFISIRGIFRELTSSFKRFWDDVVKKFNSIKSQGSGFWEKFEKVLEVIQLGGSYHSGDGTVLDPGYIEYRMKKEKEEEERIKAGGKPEEKSWLQKQIDKITAPEKEGNFADDILKKGIQTKKTGDGVSIDSHDTNIYAYSAPMPGGKSLTGSDTSNQVEINAENFFPFNA